MFINFFLSLYRAFKNAFKSNKSPSSKKINLNFIKNVIKKITLNVI